MAIGMECGNDGHGSGIGHDDTRVLPDAALRETGRRFKRPIGQKEGSTARRVIAVQREPIFDGEVECELRPTTAGSQTASRFIFDTIRVCSSRLHSYSRARFYFYCSRLTYPDFFCSRHPYATPSP